MRITNKKITKIISFILVSATVFSMFLININSIKVFNEINSAPKDRKLPIYSVSTEEKKVALTFDAAWGADKTEGIMKILDDNGAKGTFFLVGFWVRKYPEMVKKIYDKGFTVGNHSNNHLKMSQISAEEIRKEISVVNDEINKITGHTPRFFRPPFGDYNNTLINGVESLGMQPIQWDVDSLDWKGLSATEILKRVTTKVKNGSIILFHNNSENILDALPLVISALKKEGYTPVTLDELVHKDNYIINNFGQQIKKNN